ncbi:peroxiredoxin [Thermococcus pacificus]|uniref:thioredoxin-dependent peroxiredoxin n=1 Tax=Thermococcus pacificus TaxID=71998 RepID=A0A218P920_9EURY|nr:peroxiredoxin [Thermococcus pacificus]ASJ07230.1 peroxiredoxin [Thermococcus pacificus]
MNPLEVKVLDEEGKELPLKDAVLGRWTVLYVYPKDNTPGCTTEAKEFTELLPEFEKLGFQVIGVSKDSVKSHLKFKEKHNLKVRLLSDPNAELIKALGAWGKKKRYGKEYEGVIRSTFILNPEGEIVWKKINVRAKGHAAKVLEEAKKLVRAE